MQSGYNKICVYREVCLEIRVLIVDCTHNVLPSLTSNIATEKLLFLTLMEDSQWSMIHGTQVSAVAMLHPVYLDYDTIEIVKNVLLWREHFKTFKHSFLYILIFWYNYSLSSFNITYPESNKDLNERDYFVYMKMINTYLVSPKNVPEWEVGSFLGQFLFCQCHPWYLLKKSNEKQKK